MFWSILLTAQSFREFIIRLINDRKAKQEGSSRYKKKPCGEIFKSLSNSMTRVTRREDQRRRAV